MDIQSFIQSGLLESYVLEQVTAEERSLVERMLTQHPEAQVELAAIEQALESYAQAMATVPPAWMKGRILDQIAQLAPPTAVPLPSPTALPSPILPRTLQLAVLLLLLASAFLWNRNNQLRTENADQLSENAAQLADCTRRSENNVRLLAMFKDTATRIIRVRDLKGSPGSMMVYSNTELKQVVLNIKDIPTPSREGLYFQCWAIVDGKPQNMGMVQTDVVDGWKTLKYYEHATQYAISEEDKPNGNLSPTTVVMGSADKISG